MSEFQIAVAHSLSTLLSSIPKADYERFHQHLGVMVGVYFDNVIHGQVEVLQFFQSIHVLCNHNEIR